MYYITHLMYHIMYYYYYHYLLYTVFAIKITQIDLIYGKI